MHGLITDINTLERLVDAVDPRINQHFKSLDVTWPIVVTKWFICLFVEVLPIEVSLINFLYYVLHRRKTSKYVLYLFYFRQYFEFGIVYLQKGIKYYSGHR